MKYLIIQKGNLARVRVNASLLGKIIKINLPVMEKKFIITVIIVCKYFLGASYLRIV